MDATVLLPAIIILYAQNIKCSYTQALHSTTVHMCMDDTPVASLNSPLCTSTSSLKSSTGFPLAERRGELMVRLEKSF